MDLLSEVVSLLGPTAAVSKPISGRGEWGVRYLAHDAPGFTIVLSGQAWLTLDGRAPLQLSAGRLCAAPDDARISLSSAPGKDCVLVEPRNEAVRHGDQGGTADFVALGGSFAFDRVNAPALAQLDARPWSTSRLPSVGGRRFGRFIDLLAEECATDFPGPELIIQRMLEERCLWKPCAGAAPMPRAANRTAERACGTSARARFFRRSTPTCGRAGPSPRWPRSPACRDQLCRAVWRDPGLCPDRISGAAGAWRSQRPRLRVEQ